MADPPARREDSRAPATDEARPVPRPSVVGWSGPLPPPYILDQYSRYVDGGAERVFQQFEDEAAHRRTIEDRASRAEEQTANRGQWLAMIFALAALGVTALAIFKAMPTVAVVVGGTTTVGVVGAFLYHRVKGS